jgi:hypothetical protein
VSKVHLIKSDDWVEVWVDGEMCFEGHDAREFYQDLLVRLGHEVTAERVEICAWCDERFPEGTLRRSRCEACWGE